MAALLFCILSGDIFISHPIPKFCLSFFLSSLKRTLTIVVSFLVCLHLSAVFFSLSSFYVINKYVEIDLQGVKTMQCIEMEKFPT